MLSQKICSFPQTETVALPRVQLLKSIDSQHGQGERSSLMLQEAVRKRTAARIIIVLVFAIALVFNIVGTRGVEPLIGAAGPAIACPSPGPGKSRLSRVPNSLVFNLLGESCAPVCHGKAY